MSERLITLPLTAVHAHPDNPRIDAAADEELVDSIRTHGVIEPPLVAPDPALEDVFVLLDGHRRYDGAQRAALAEMTFRVRDDLVTTAQQIEVMAITGLQKELLSPIEEARAYEQLVLLGMDEKQIAKSTGYTRARVKQRLRLNGLTKETQAAVHAGQATLVDVEAFHEFADDSTAIERLEEALGSSNFAYEVQQLRSRRSRIERYAEMVAGFEELGAVKADPQKDSTRSLSAWEWRNSELSEPEAHTHTECLGYLEYGPESYAEPRLVCLDATSHDAPATGADDTSAEREAEQADWEAQQAQRAERAAQENAAAAARRAWLTEHFSALLPVKGHAPLARTLTGLLPAALSDARLVDLLDEGSLLGVLGVERPEERSWEAQRAAAFDAALELTVTTPTRVLGVFAAFLGSWFADLLSQSYIEDEELPTVLWAWDWLADSGYPMSDPDTEKHAALTARAAESAEGGDE